ncbi:hypothetical protein, partial [Halothiobacillus sp.]|uniref:hypothetical protein n=1 Tax=Halothiobacillus sp. TaxID=1891311 RepID=UPI003D10A7C0
VFVHAVFQPKAGLFIGGEPISQPNKLPTRLGIGGSHDAVLLHGLPCPMHHWQNRRYRRHAVVVLLV